MSTTVSVCEAVSDLSFDPSDVVPTTPSSASTSSVVVAEATSMSISSTSTAGAGTLVLGSLPLPARASKASKSKTSPPDEAAAEATRRSLPASHGPLRTLSNADERASVGVNASIIWNWNCKERMVSSIFFCA